MLSPFLAGDPRIDAFIPLEERRVLRRSQPTRLRFDDPGPSILLRTVVAAPQPLRRPSRLRVRLGEALMALGQRLAGADATS